MRFKNYSHFLFSLIVFVSSSVYGQGAQHAENNSMIRFTENKNQWDSKILYKANLDGGAMFLERNGFTYNLYDKEAVNENHAKENSNTRIAIGRHAFRMTFLNSLKTASVQSQNPTSDYCNYFIGNDKRRWAENVKNYKSLKYVSLYPDINLEIEGLENSLKYNFIVAPHGNTENIKMLYEGLDQISLEKGALKFKTRICEWTEHKPYAYQWAGNEKVEVPCEFVLKNNTVYFSFPKGYNKEQELIIDPLLVFSASSGSLANNFGHSCTYDAAGNLYSGGISFGTGYPTKLAYDNTFAGGNVDVVITKYNAVGNALIYSTYLGGISDEIVTSMIVDAADNLYLYGVTGSADFPVDAGAYQKTFNGGLEYTPHAFNGNYYPDGTDIYVCKFSAAGDKLLASTFIGGSDNDGINCNNADLNNEPLDSLQYNYGDYYRGEIDLDKSGNVYVVTSTRSKDFKIVNGFDNTLGGLQDALVFKMDNSLSNVIWSSFLGGSSNDGAYSLILDDTLNVYVTGGTASADFPTSTVAVQKNYKGAVDGFVAKIKADGSSIASSTYWGTDKYDQSFFVQLDKNNDVYLFGQTEGKMPVQNAAYSNPNSSQFVTKLNNNLTKIGFSTVVGNGQSLPNICPTAFLVDLCGNIYVAGWAAGFKKGPNGGNLPVTNMPITAGSLDGTTDGYDFYLMVLGANANSLTYGMYWGGNLSQEHVHGGTSRFDKKGIVYQSLCTGCGGNDDYPVMPPGTWPNDSTNVNGSTNCNNAVFKIDFQPQPIDAEFTVDSAKGCAPFFVKFVNKSVAWTDYIWDFGNGDTTSVISSPSHTYTVPGTYKVKLITRNRLCNTIDSTFLTITVYPTITADFDALHIKCTDTVKFTDKSVANPVSWLWNFDDGTSSTLQNPVHVYKQTGSYDAQLIVKSVDGCKDTVTVSFDNTYSVSVNKDTLVCEGSSVQLQAKGGYSYKWLPITGLNDPNIANPVATVTTNTTYTVQISYVNALGDSCSKDLTTTVSVFDKNTIKLDATADATTVIQSESTTLHATINPVLPILWTPSTDVKDPTALNTLVTPSVTTTYTVSIVGAGNCSRSDTVTIYVISNECGDDDIFVPNTFTPNGDGENDMLYARSNVVSSIYFAVYNRWGELMFETTDLKQGWDGNYKGMKADPAVFAWYVKGKCLNRKDFFKKGNVTLIR